MLLVSQSEVCFYIRENLFEMTVYNVFNQMSELISELEPERVLSLNADEEMKDRLEKLIEKSKQEGLNFEEKDELDHYIVLERLVRLAKIKSRLRNNAA